MEIRCPICNQWFDEPSLHQEIQIDQIIHALNRMESTASIMAQYGVQARTVRLLSRFVSKPANLTDSYDPPTGTIVEHGMSLPAGYGPPTGTIVEVGMSLDEQEKLKLK